MTKSFARGARWPVFSLPRPHSQLVKPPEAKRKTQAFALLAGLLLLASCDIAPQTEPPTDPLTDPPGVSWADIQAQSKPLAGHRIAYGDNAHQFGELRMPEGEGPHPLVVLIHGGCWQQAFDLDHLAPLAQDLADRGVATWSLEYRRIGNDGGGWPGTFDDISNGVAHVNDLAQHWPLDLNRVLLAGHSAGGHLALWLVSARKPPAVRGVVALAPIADLSDYARGEGSCNRSVAELMGGMPDDMPDRYLAADPIQMLPSSVPVRLVHGQLDPIVPPEQSRRYVDRALAAGDNTALIELPAAGQLDPIAPFADEWVLIVESIESLLATD